MKKWHIAQEDREWQQKLQEKFNLTKQVAQILRNRGLTSLDEVEKFLRPALSQLHSPYLFKDMEKAVERIKEAVKNREKIIIYGDYDVDGVTATSVLIHAFRKLNYDVDFYLPDRFAEGYGINNAALERFRADGVKLVITVDCGISSVDEIEYAKEQGIDVIITDHHQIKDAVPQALAVLNPHLDECSYPFCDLAGVGVAFKLAQAISGELLEELLDLVALGTVADIVPLLGENRIFVKFGLERINEFPRPGVQALCEKAGIEIGKVKAEQIGYGLGPRMNAAGRLEHAGIVVELLTTGDINRARTIAAQLDVLNQRRQEMEREILEEALLTIDKEGWHEEKVLLLQGDNWHHGVLGIVASKICERFYRPTILLGMENGEGKGSARSIPGFHIYDALRRCEQFLERYGGHSQAAGLTVRAENVPLLRQALRRVGEELDSDLFCPVLEIDAVVQGNEVNPRLLEEISWLEPYGMGNPCPLFIISGAKILNFKGVGANGKHLKLRFSANGVIFDAIGFNLIDIWQEEFLYGETDIAFYPEFNIFNGMRTIQLKIVDIKRTEQGQNSFTCYLGKVYGVGSFSNMNILQSLFIGQSLELKKIISNSKEAYCVLFEGKVLGYLADEFARQLDLGENLENFSCHVAWVCEKPSLSLIVGVFPKQGRMPKKLKRDIKPNVERLDVFGENILNKVNQTRIQGKKAVFLFRDRNLMEKLFKKWVVYIQNSGVAVYEIHEKTENKQKADFLLALAMNKDIALFTTVELMESFFAQPAFLGSGLNMFVCSANGLQSDLTH